MSKPQRLVLLSDEPLDSQELRAASAHRLDPIIESMLAQLSAWLGSRSDAPPRLGLFGGLGQGKSSAMREVVRRLEASDPSWTGFHLRWRLLGPPIALFDSSHYKADDLEWRLLSAVVWRRVPRGLFWQLLIGGLVFAVLGWALHSRWQDAGFDLFALICAGALAAWKLVKQLKPALGLLKPAGNALAATAKTVNLGAGLDYTARDLLALGTARFLSVAPRLVIIDDLDRARLEQQRALLRALHRYSRLMGFAVVVCMDEAPLLASRPDPESPEELLRKTISVEFRVPDRSLEDIALLAVVALRDAAKVNENRRDLLAHPALVADFARLLAIWPGAVSPRLVKRMLNDALVRVDALQGWALDLVAAALRLQGLLLLAPSLHQHSDALRDALERNSSTVFADLAARLTPALEILDRQALVRLFARSRAMQPAAGYGWYQLLNAVPFAPSELDAEPACWPKNPAWSTDAPVVKALQYLTEVFSVRLHRYSHGRFVWETVQPEPGTAMPAGHPDAKSKRSSLPIFGMEHRRDGDLQVDQLPSTWRVDDAASDEFFAWCWVLWLASLQRLAGPWRLRAYAVVQDWIAVDSGLCQTGRPPRMAEALRLALLREQIADDETWPLRAAEDRQQLAEQLLATTDRPAIPSLLWLLPLAAQDFALATRLLDERSHPRDAQARVRWLASATTWLPPGDADARRTDRTLRDHWPPLMPVAWNAEEWHRLLSVHLQHWVRLKPGGETTVPLPLVVAWCEARGLLSNQQRAELLAVVALDTAPSAGWQLDRLAIFHEETRLAPPSPKAGLGDEAAIDWLARDLQPGPQLAALWWALLCRQDVKASALDGLRQVTRDEAARADWRWIDSSAARRIVGGTAEPALAAALLALFGLRAGDFDGAAWRDRVTDVIESRTDNLQVWEAYGRAPPRLRL